MLIPRLRAANVTMEGTVTMRGNVRCVRWVNFKTAKVNQRVNSAQTQSQLRMNFVLLVKNPHGKSLKIANQSTNISMTQMTTE